MLTTVCKNLIQPTCYVGKKNQLLLGRQNMAESRARHVCAHNYLWPQTMAM
jgi:hypothetical protein